MNEIHRNKKQLLALCVCHVVIYAGIAGLVGLMPVYLTQLGADSAGTGFFLAFVYLALALSNVVGGWLSNYFQRRKVFLILGGVVASPIAWLMGQATTVGQLVFLMACLWFVIGIPMVMVTILTGLCSEATKRGRNFGILSLSAGVGLFVGGLVSGPIVDRFGFPALFTDFAAFYLLIAIVGYCLQDRVMAAEQKSSTADLSNLFRQRTFTLLFVACIFAQTANIVIFLSRPLRMHALHFDATTISTAAAIGSVVTLPLPLMLGWLADRRRKKLIILGCFLAPPLGY